MPTCTCHAHCCNTHPCVPLLQYNLRIARTEGADASQRADEASASHDNIRQKYDDAQAEAKEAAAVAAAQISDLQVIAHALQLCCLPS